MSFAYPLNLHERISLQSLQNFTIWIKMCNVQWFSYLKKQGYWIYTKY